MAEVPDPGLSARFEDAVAHNNLSVQKLNEGDADGAEVQSGRAVAVYRELVQSAGSLFSWHLATSLLNYANNASFAGHAETAVDAATEGTAILADLARADPERHRLDHARALRTLGLRMADADRVADGIAAMNAARNELAAVTPVTEAAIAEAYELMFNLAGLLLRSGDLDGASRAAEAALSGYRQLADVRPGAFDLHVARSLSRSADALSRLERAEEALNRAEAAVLAYLAIEARLPAGLHDEVTRARDQYVTLALAAAGDIDARHIADDIAARFDSSTGRR